VARPWSQHLLAVVSDAAGSLIEQRQSASTDSGAIVIRGGGDLSRVIADVPAFPRNHHCRCLTGIAVVAVRMRETCLALFLALASNKSDPVSGSPGAQRSVWSGAVSGPVLGWGLPVASLECLIMAAA